MVFANRSVENANKLAHAFQAYSIDLKDIDSHLFEADMLFTSTASPDPILQQKDFIAAIKQRKQKPMFVLDLAVPRDIDPKVKEIENIYLYSIDDLQDIVAGNQKARLDEAEKANEIVSIALGEFNQAQNLRIASPAIRQLREHYEQQRNDLLGSALEKLNDGNAEQIITQLAHQLTNRLLHHPTKELRSAMLQNNSEKMEQLLKFLLPDDQDNK
jgi:glutamyl-tRNA reductase